jgi:hypothetical protein
MCIRSRIGLIGSGSGTAEFCNGGEVAGAGFVPKSVAEDNGAFILDNSESGDVTRHDFQKRARKSAFLEGLRVGTGQMSEEGASFLTTLLSFVVYCALHAHEIPARQG